MYYYEVLVADGKYHSDTPLIYGSEQLLKPLNIVSVPLRNASVTGFVIGQTSKPSFAVKGIKKLLSETSLPEHCLELAYWTRDYYAAKLGEVLKQFAPTTPILKNSVELVDIPIAEQVDLDLDAPLTSEQVSALGQINTGASTTMMLHGDTGSGKTRVYLELAKQSLDNGKSVIILTPEIALTAQLKLAASKKISAPTYIIHSQLSPSERKKIWLKILESEKPVLVIGPRSALFAPIASLGLIVIDEAHEPAYKQEQSPRYSAIRVASQLGMQTGARVVLGSATPPVSDYYLAQQKDAVVRMSLQARSSESHKIKFTIVDHRDKANFKQNYVISNQLIDAIKTTLAEGNQALLYHNLRGTSRLVLCNKCGWQLVCPNCDIPLVYHADKHEARCHICGFKKMPPPVCPTCANTDIIYKSIGTKALVEIVQKLFPNARIHRFDSDSAKGERLNEVYDQLHDGQIDILIGTQQVAKGLDLPKLALVGIISAESSLALPDFTAEERAFQLLYQVIGRVGRGHIDGSVIIQTYEPDSAVIKYALNKDYESFYKKSLLERQTYRFPPYSYLLKLVCRRSTLAGAQKAAATLKDLLISEALLVEIVGPAPSFYQRRGRYFYWQVIVKAKNRKDLLRLASLVPAGWSIDLDPADLL